ncbi:MAG: hypothetical protein ABIO70_18450 [Pseudomonadota bacterium]
MRPTAPPPSPAPRPAEPPPAPPEEAWPPEGDENDDLEQIWPDEPHQGSITPWPDDGHEADPAADPWPAEANEQCSPEDTFPDPEDPTDPAVALPDEREPRHHPAAGRRILGLVEPVILAGRIEVPALCATSLDTSTLAARLESEGSAQVLRLRSGATLPAHSIHDGSVLLDLEIAGLPLHGVRLALTDVPGAPDLVIARDLLAGRFLVDPAGI